MAASATVQKGARFGLHVRANRHYQLLLDVPQQIDPNVPEGQVIDQLTQSVLDTHPVGTAETCVQRLVEQIRVSGCRRVLCQVEVIGDYDSVLANVKRLGEEVLPEVRRRLAAS